MTAPTWQRYIVPHPGFTKPLSVEDGKPHTIVFVGGPLAPNMVGPLRPPVSVEQFPFVAIACVPPKAPALESATHSVEPLCADAQFGAATNKARIDATLSISLIDAAPSEQRSIARYAT
jgi:hypothetical protein